MNTTPETIPFCTTERAHAAEALARAFDAFRAGRDAPPPPPAPGPSDAQLEEELLSYVYGHLTPADRAALRRVGEYRETALASSRVGEQAVAEGTMKAARLVLGLAGLTPLARAAADTLQHAADAYLSYRAGRFDEAKARMEAAIRATDVLADAWGESRFTASRRIHLFHNIMRVDVRQGDPAAAMALGRPLLARLAGAPFDGALAALERDGPPIDAQVAVGFCNAIAASVAEALAPLSAAEAAALLGDPLPPAANPAVREAAGWGWLALKHAALADGPVRLLETAAPFLRAGPGRTPVLWCAAALELLRAAETLDAAGYADGISEIAAALAAARRLPQALQPALAQAA